MHRPGMIQSDVMKKIILIASLIALSGCSINRTAEVSSVDTTSGVVRLTYGQAALQSAYTDSNVANGTATRQCQQMGYATAVPYGQPITTCSVTSASVCLNENVTLQYQCRGVAFSHSASSAQYW